MLKYRLLSAAAIVTCFLLTNLVVATAQDPQNIPIVAYITSPDPARSFALTDQGISIMGTVIYDPAVMDYWKIDIRGTASNSFIGADLMDRTLAFNWLTLDDVRRESVVEGELARIPGYPHLSPGGWIVRLVIVGHDSNFPIPPIEIPFSVAVPDTDPAPVSITRPAAGERIRQGTSVIGNIQLNQFATSYRVELLGGDYTTWTVISGPFENDVAHPIVIRNGQIATLPALNSLQPGQYRLRVVVTGLDSNNLQDPYEVQFAIGTSTVSNLPSAEITQPRVNNSALTASGGTPLIGTVVVPEGASHYHVDIKDNIPANSTTQSPRFTDWSEISRSTQSITDGQIAVLPSLPQGGYLLRVVIVNSNGEFADEPYQLNLNVPAQAAPVETRNTAAVQEAGGTSDAPAVITSPSITTQASGTVVVPTIPQGQDIPILGTVVMPPGAQYWKVEVRGGNFNDWTTIGETRTDTIRDGQLAFLPGPPYLPRGEYRLRLVIVGNNGDFVGTPFEVPFRV